MITYKTLLKYKLIKKKNINIFSRGARDNSKLLVFQDKVEKVIFLKNNTLKPSHYEKMVYKKDRYPLNDSERRIDQFKKFLKNKNILDVGCGTGDFLKKIKGAKSLNGLEVSMEYISNIKKKSKEINMYNNFNQIKKKFDTITLFHVLEHIEDPVNFLNKIKKFLKKSGHLIIEVPSANDYLLNHKISPDYVKNSMWAEHFILYTPAVLKKFLNLSKLKSIKMMNFQRYNLNNHLHWFIKGKPCGHMLYKAVKNKKMLEEYDKNLVKLKQADTLIAIAKL